MREYSTPSSFAVPSSGSLTDDIVVNGVEHPESVSLCRRTAAGQPWTAVTAAEFLTEVRRTAKGLLAAGVRSGDRVALLSRNRFEWTLLDYAIWYVGAATVPVYDSSSADEVRWILADSGCRAVVVDTEQRAAEVARVRDDTDVEQLWILDLDGAAGALAVLAALGEQVTDAELERRRAGVAPGDLATVIYTSGTTGRPKGCALTHGNFMVVLAGLAPLFDADDASTLLLLPLPHVFARIVQLGAIRQRVRLGHTSDPRRLVEDLAEFRPTFVLAVPRLFEKIFTTASLRAAAEGRGRLFDRATDVAIAFSRASERGRVGPLLRVQHAMLDRVAYQPLRALLGGRCRYAVSGGAPLGERLGHFYRGIGLTVLEGYGLTETSGVATLTTPDAVRVGAAGRPIPGTAVRVDDDGELLVRGGQVFGGYWGDDAAARQVLTGEGWLRTGDLGEIDAEGFVRVTGRKREIIVTSGGKAVAPSILEDGLRAHHLVSQCMVVGDGKPYVAALVTLDEEAVGRWAEKRGKAGRVRRVGRAGRVGRVGRFVRAGAVGTAGALASLADDPELLAELQAGVDDANKAVSQAEAIRRFKVLPADWSEETGELTPSLKLRRNVVMREFRHEVDALYEG